MYKQVRLTITPAQQKKALKGSGIRLGPSCLNRGQVVMLHPLNVKKVASAKNGITLQLSEGEMMRTAMHHGLVPKQSGDLEGSGIFDSIWSGIKSAGKWLAGAALDGVEGAASEAIPGLSGVFKKVRGGVRDLTGVGIKKRGRPKKIIGNGLYL